MAKKTNLKRWIKKGSSVNEIGLYLAHGCKIHPKTYDVFLDELQEMQNKGKLSLTPNTIFQVFHQKLRKSA